MLLRLLLLLIPQRYEFSSKSQLYKRVEFALLGCCWYHKGTNFQANHNLVAALMKWKRVVADTTKVRIFKQITTVKRRYRSEKCCCWYHKGTNFQANHNMLYHPQPGVKVVADTTKVRIFKQITTTLKGVNSPRELLLIPQRYEFSSKSQLW